MTQRAHCWICSIPMIVIVGVLLSFTASAAVQLWRLEDQSTRIGNLEREVSSLHDSLTEMKIILRTVKNIEKSLNELSQK